MFTFCLYALVTAVGNSISQWLSVSLLAVTAASRERGGSPPPGEQQEQALTLSAVASTGTHAKPVRISLVSFTSTCARFCDPGAFRSHVCNSRLFSLSFYVRKLLRLSIMGSLISL